MFDSAPIESSSADPQKEPILIEITDAFSQKFLILFNFYPSSNFSLCQILPEEIPMQEQESNGFLIENNLAIADIQTVDSPIQHTTDGKKVTCSIYFSATNMN